MTLSLPLTVTFLLFAQLAAGQGFISTPLNSSSSLSAYSKTYWLDADRDGDLDLLESYLDPYSSTSSFLKLYKNEDQVFTVVNNAFGGVPFYPYSLAFGDYDLDSDVDILIANETGVMVAINSGALSFTLQNTGVGYATYSSKAQWQDIDGDLDLDILFLEVGYTGEHAVWVNKNGVYSPSIQQLPSNLRNISWADVNNDGRPDFVATKGNTAYVNPMYLYISEGDGAFSERGLLTPGFGDDNPSLWFDSDADHDLDLLITEMDGKVTLFRNTLTAGNASLERAFSFPNLNSAKAAVGDINMDGLADVVLAGENHPNQDASVYLNSLTTGPGKFTKISLGIQFSSCSNLHMVDIDKDLDLDIFFDGFTNSSQLTKISNFYKSNFTGGVSIPAIPQNLSSAIGDQVSLSWSHTDGGHSYYYDIELKRNGTLVNSTLSLSNGSPLVPAAITNRLTKELKLRDLPEGNYEWRVHSIDPAYRSSGYSASSTFSISAAPAQLQLTEDNFNRVTLTWADTQPTAGGFAVCRRSSFRPLKVIANLPAGQVTYTDAGIPANENIEYTVRAVNAGIYSASSNTVNFYSGQFIEEPFDPAGPNIITATGRSADLDNDGDYDMGFSGRIDFIFGHSLRLLNDGTGSYTSGAFLPGTPDAKGPMVLRDIDNDGDMDVCQVEGDDYSWQRLCVYAWNGSTYTKVFTTQDYLGIFQIAAQDLNHDGLTDLLFSHRIGNWTGRPQTYTLMFQTSAGNFENSGLQFAPEASSNIGTFSIADLNNDGFSDLLFAGIETVKAKIFLSVNGNGFKEMVTTLPTLIEPFIFDSNGDGYPDIVQRNLSGLEVYRADANLNFSPAANLVSVNTGNSSFSMQAADLDMNGLPEIIASNGMRPVILHNYGNGVFNPAIFDFSSNWNTRVFITDKEGDGDLDIVRLANDDAHLGINAIYKNRFASPQNNNSPPTAPSSLSAEIHSEATVFSWLPSTDNTTSAAFITYNLEVKDLNGKIWVNPETNNPGTFQLVLGTGNVGAQTKATVNRLPAGQYTARVQALDAAFALSGWSSPLNFTIAEGPANLAAERILLNKVRLTWASGPGAETKVVVKRKSTGNNYEVIASLPPNSTEFVDILPEFNKLYTYLVFEEINGAATAPSNEKTWNTNFFKLESTPLPNVGGPTVAELSGDGKMDLMVLGGRIFSSSYVEIVSAFFEQAAPNWVRHDIATLLQPQISNVSVLDLNGDYLPDLFRSGYGPSLNFGTEILINNGDNTYSTVGHPFTTEKYSFLCSWDADNDNDLDLYVRTNPPNQLSQEQLLKNNGLGNFSPRTVSFPLCSSCSFAAVGDVDNDGDEDQWRYDPSIQGYALYMNSTGNMIRGVTLTTLQSPSVQLIDYNQDGLLDFFATGNSGFYSYDKTKLYKNLGPDSLGTLHFQKITETLPSSDGSNATWADFDHDGDLDFALSARDILIYFNDGGDAFREYRIPSIYGYSNPIRWIDFDSDGDLDLYMVGSFTINGIEGTDQPFSWVLKNQLIDDGRGTPNSAPTPPGSIAASYTPSGTQLKWDGASDDHGSMGLTYDVVISRNEKIFAKGPLHPTTGKRYRLEQGRSVSKLTLSGLDPGTYTWKVQAIDPSFASSTFSLTGSFLAKLTQLIVYDPLMERTMGTGPFNITATATSGLPLAFSSNDKVTISGNQMSLVKPGKAKILAEQPGNIDYYPAAPIKLEFCINPARPVVTLNPTTSTLRSDQAIGNQWFKSGVPIIGATSQILIPPGPGVYTVKVNVDVCSSEMSAPFTFTVTGIEDTNQRNIANVYPNPTSGLLYIDCYPSADSHSVRIHIYGLQGQAISTNELVQNGTHWEGRLNMRDLPAGMYVYHITNEAGVVSSGKIVVK